MTESITIQAAPVVVMIPTRDIHPNPNHYREVTKAGLDDLEQRVRASRRISPLVVVRDGGIYWISEGHHRHGIAQPERLGLDALPCIVCDDWEEADTAIWMVASNFHVPESDIDRSKGTQLLLSTGAPIQTVARATGYDTDTLTVAAKGYARFTEFSGETMEPTSMERFIALGEFAGDDDAVDELLHADEKDVLRIIDRQRKARRLLEYTAIAEATIKAAGCEAFTVSTGGITFVNTTKHDGKAPEGSTVARISPIEWSGEVQIHWYKPSTNVEDPEEEARRNAEAEARETARAEADTAQAARIAFVVDYFTGKVEDKTDALRKFAETTWESGTTARSSILEDVAITGLFPRFYASVVLDVNRSGSTLFFGSKDAWYMKASGKVVLSLLSALKSAGYELSPSEEAVEATVREALKCPECDGDGRPFAADGSRNGNAKCAACQGTGVAS